MFEIYQDQAGDWRWRLVAANGATIADSSEGYTREADVERAIRTVLDVAHNAGMRRV